VDTDYVVTPIAATIDLDRAAADLWDVIVIGAGPAGASVARLLAVEGRTVLLVERKAFPRDKVCGGCLNHHAVAMLARSGVDHELRAQGAQTLTAIHLHSGGRRAMLALPPGLAVTRATLDAVLVRRSIAAGCAFLPEVTASVTGDGDTDAQPGPVRHVTLEQGGRARVCVTTRVVVIAGGLGHQALRDVPSMHLVVDDGARVGVGAVVESDVVDVAGGVVTMATGRGGYVGVTRVEGGRVNLAAALDVDGLKAAGGPAAAVRAILASARIEAGKGLDAVTWQGTVPMTRRLSTPAAHRIFVLGDAAGYVEPFTGEGMAWALSASDALAPMVMRGLSIWNSDLERQWQGRYGTLVKDQQRRCRAVARVLRHPAVAHLMVATLSRYPGLADVLMPGLTRHAAHEERA